MIKKLGPEDLDITIKFGGGLHTRASEDEIDPREAKDGQNFLLDLENRELRNRPAFDLVGTAPNGQPIRGGGSLLKADGSVSFLIQAGDTVYDWDGLSTFTPKKNVLDTSRLRGNWRTQNWTLDDKLILTDLSLDEVVKEYDGSALTDTVFTDENDASFGTFYAKYLNITNERAVFGNLRDPSTTTNHLIVGSARGNYKQITVTNRPSSGLSEADPFFLITPDLRSVNGFVEAFGTSIISTEQGQLFKLSGQSAQDFLFDDFYPGSAASGEESLAYIGNDIIFGRQGRIESVRDTERFGDAENDDITVPVANAIRAYTGWTTVYNSRLNRVYLFPEGVGEGWVFETSMRGGKLSPWMRWTTQHPVDFQPTFVMSMLDPVDTLEYVFMGDGQGKLYRVEGTGTGGDGGSASMRTEWLTNLISSPLDSQASGIEGYIKYRKNEAATVSLTFEYAGESAYNETITIDIPEITGRPVYGGGLYYGNNEYYGTSFSGRLVRQQIFPPGQSNEFQVRVTVEGTTNFEINEIGIRFIAASD